MSGNTIDILFNASGNNDNTKTDQLIKALNNFESILTKFTETSKNYAGGNPNLNNTKTFVNEIQTAIKNSNDKQNSYKASPFPNNTAISGLKNDYRDHLFKNEGEQPKFQKDALSRATSEGIKRGVKDSGLESLFKVGIAGFVGKQIVSGIGNYYGYQTQIGSSGLVNPLTSGGNYGTLSANALLASKQQENSLGTTIATIGGGALGAFFGPAGILAGSAIGSGLGSIVSSASNSTAQLKAQARSDAINQRINNLSLIGTNANASGLIGQVTGLNGKKLNATTNNANDLFNPLLPIATEISKGVGTYKRNFEAMDMLTKYAVSANLPLQELSKLGSSAAMLNLNGTQLTNAANLASGAGVGLTDLNIRTLMFQQGGLSIDAAQRAAAGSFSNTGSYQAREQEFYGGSKLTQMQQIMAGKAMGFDIAAYLNPSDPNHAKIVKQAGQMMNDKSGVGPAILDYFGITQSMQNSNNPNGMNIQSGNARMGVESNIADMLNANQQNKTNALTDKDVANNVTATMSKFTDSVLGSNSSLDGFKSALVEVTSVLQNMQNVGRAFISGGSFMTSGATSSVLDYGNKGAK